ncbi:hypothetical protein [Nocardia sp. NPDC004260]
MARQVGSLAHVTPEQMNAYGESIFPDLIGLYYTNLSTVPDRVGGEWVVKPHLQDPAGLQNEGVYCTTVKLQQLRQDVINDLQGRTVAHSQVQPKIM